MQPSSTSVIAIRPTAGFQAHPFSVVELQNGVYFVAKQVGAILGYSDNGAVLSRMITGEWSDRLRVEDHYRHASTQELTEMKNWGGVASAVVGARARDLLLLTEQGLYRVMMLSAKPMALAFQDWLASEVLPSLRRTGSYELPKRAPVVAKPGLSELEDVVRRVVREELSCVAVRQPASRPRVLDDEVRMLFGAFLTWARTRAEQGLDWCVVRQGEVLRCPAGDVRGRVDVDAAGRPLALYFQPSAVEDVSRRHAERRLELLRTWAAVGLLDVRECRTPTLQGARWSVRLPGGGPCNLYKIGAEHLTEWAPLDLVSLV